MGKYEWLLFLHMTGAFLFLGAAVASLIFTVAAQRLRAPERDRAHPPPRSRYVIAAFAIGGLLLLVFGLWLVDDAGYELQRRLGDRRTRPVHPLERRSAPWAASAPSRPAQLAERLAPENDEPSAELKARLRDPVTLALDYGAACSASPSSC